MLGLGTGQRSMDEGCLYGGEGWKRGVESGYEVAERWVVPGPTGDPGPVFNGSVNKLILSGRRTSLGLHLDLTIGLSLPAMIPGLLPTSQGASKELSYTLTPLHPGQTFSGAVPPPLDKPSGITPANADIDVGEEVVGVHLVPVREEGGRWVVRKGEGIRDLRREVVGHRGIDVVANAPWRGGLGVGRLLHPRKGTSTRLYLCHPSFLATKAPNPLDPCRNRQRPYSSKTTCDSPTLSHTSSIISPRTG
jgi:hypothetical protein